MSDSLPDLCVIIVPHPNSLHCLIFHQARAMLLLLYHPTLVTVKLKPRVSATKNSLQSSSSSVDSNCSSMANQKVVHTRDVRSSTLFPGSRKWFYFSFTDAEGFCSCPRMPQGVTAENLLLLFPPTLPVGTPPLLHHFLLIHWYILVLQLSRNSEVDYVKNKKLLVLFCSL